jgi:RimJ/RimL family protein N-acetyltransferase
MRTEVDPMLLWHPRPAIIGGARATAYGIATGVDLRPHPTTIAFGGPSGLTLVPFVGDSVIPMTQMLTAFPELSNTVGVARNARSAKFGHPSRLHSLAESAVFPFVSKRIAGFESGKMISYAALNPTNELLGWVDVWPIESPFPNAFEIGVVARPDLWGTGLARNLVRIAGAMAIDQLGARRIEMSTDESNHACRRLCESLGFDDHGYGRRLQQAMDPPSEVLTHWFSWTSPELRAPAAIPGFRFQSKRAVRRPFESDRFMAEWQHAVAADKSNAGELIDQARAELEGHFRGRHSDANADFQIAVHLRAVVFGVLARSWTSKVRYRDLNAPQDVVEALREPDPQALPPAAQQFHLQHGSTLSIPGEFHNRSHETLSGNDNRFFQAIMRRFLDVRRSQIEHNPEYQPLLDLASSLHAEWQRAAAAVGKTSNYQPSKPARRLDDYELGMQIQDPLSGTISTALVHLIYVYRHLPESVRLAASASPPDGELRKTYSALDLQKAVGQSHGEVTGVLVEVGHTKFAEATGRESQLVGRGPFRPDELAVEFDAARNLSFRLADPALQNPRRIVSGMPSLRGRSLTALPNAGEHVQRVGGDPRIPRKCPFDSDLPGATAEERFITAASFDDALLHGYLSPESREAPDVLSAEEELLRVVIPYLPLLWDGQGNEFCDVDVRRGQTLAHRQFESFFGLGIPRSENEVRWGMGPMSRYDVGTDAEVSSQRFTDTSMYVFQPGRSLHE